MKALLTKQLLEDAAAEAVSFVDIASTLGLPGKYFRGKRRKQLLRQFGVDLDEVVSRNRQEARKLEQAESCAERTCKVCGKKFTTLPSEYATGDFCSKRCARSFSGSTVKGTKILSCMLCGTDVEVDCRSSRVLCESCKAARIAERSVVYKNKKSAKAYGSEDNYTSCSVNVRIKKRDLLAISLKRDNKLPEWMLVDSNGRISVDREMLNRARNGQVRGTVVWEPRYFVKSTGYVYASVPGHPRAIGHDYVYLHDIVMENLLGRTIDPDVEAVHHKDHDRFNNSPDNLLVLTHDEHSKLHAEERIMNTVWTEFECPNCGKHFFRRRSDIAGKRNKLFVACSNHCRGKLSATIQHGGITDAIRERISRNVVGDVLGKDLNTRVAQLDRAATP